VAVTDRLAAYLAVLEADGQPVGTGARAADGPIPELTSGQFHDVVLAGDVAYRFPRDEESRRLLPGRVALLTALAKQSLPVAVPVPLSTSRLERPLGSCYVPMTRLVGTPVSPGSLDSVRGTAALASQLADLLDRLAALGSDPAVRDAVQSAGPHDWRDWAEQVRSVLFPLMSAAGQRRAAAELAAVQRVPAAGDALVHTDLGGANLLLATGGSVPRLVGILDWDSATIGNQANDVASLAVTFGWPAAAQIERRRASRPLISQARLIAATFALQQALPAALSGDEASLEDGLSGYV
jgi:aminoglycoside phosphotransferase (APT) family kinase protein